LNVGRWSVLVVTPDPSEGRIVTDVLSQAGANNALLFTDSERALVHLAREQANVLVTALDAEPITGVDWVRRLRRQRECRSHKAPVVLIARSLTPAIVESCRDAGANAVIGAPVQATLISAIKRVIGRPRPFVDDADYVGPCRRRSIVTVGKLERRRSVDTAA
jgi:two-component system, chemotaxis family, chemotaxis protein CheY